MLFFRMYSFKNIFCGIFAILVLIFWSEECILFYIACLEGYLIHRINIINISNNEPFDH